MKNKGYLAFIYRYAIYRNGKCIETNIIGWRTALAHARKWSNDLFHEIKIIEILNIWTGEIISLEEAESRVKRMYARQ